MMSLIVVGVLALIGGAAAGEGGPVSATCLACLSPTSPECTAEMTNECMNSGLSLPFCMPCLNDQRSQDCMGKAAEFLGLCHEGEHDEDTSYPGEGTCLSCADMDTKDCLDALTQDCFVTGAALGYCLPCMQDMEGRECSEAAEMYLEECEMYVGDEGDEGEEAMAPQPDTCEACADPTSRECRSAMTDECIESSMGIPFCLACMENDQDPACWSSAAEFLGACDEAMDEDMDEDMELPTGASEETCVACANPMSGECFAAMSGECAATYSKLGFCIPCADGPQNPECMKEAMAFLKECEREIPTGGVKGKAAVKKAVAAGAVAMAMPDDAKEKVKAGVEKVKGKVKGKKGGKKGKKGGGKKGKKKGGKKGKKGGGKKGKKGKKGGARRLLSYFY